MSFLALQTFEINLTQMIHKIICPNETGQSHVSLVISQSHEHIVTVSGSLADLFFFPSDKSDFFSGLRGNVFALTPRHRRDKVAWK